jgi:hypothetical protein
MPCGPGVTPLKWNMTRTPGDRCSVVSGPDLISPDCEAVHQHDVLLKVLPVAAQSMLCIHTKECKHWDAPTLLVRKKVNVRVIKLAKSSAGLGHTVQETYHPGTATVGHL